MKKSFIYIFTLFTLFVFAGCNVQGTDNNILEFIEITKPAEKTEYFIGDALDTTGLEITGTYSNGEKKVIEDWVAYDFSSDEAKDSILIRIVYGECETSYAVSVKAVAVTGIEITIPPAKKEYFVGEEFDATGMVVTAVYNDGSSKAVGSYDVTFDNSKADDEAVVTVRYEGKKAEFTVKVIQSSVTSLEIVTPASKLEYFIDEELNTENLEVKAFYSDGSSKIVTEYTTSFDSSVAGEEIPVIISYEGKEVSYTVKVIAIAIAELKITNPAAKTKYFVSDTLDTTDLVVVAVMNSGETEEITTYSTEFDSSVAGEAVVKIKFGGKEVTYTVTVKEIELESIEITAAAEKTEYFVSEKLDTTGLEITATYNNGVTNVVSSYETEFDSSEPGEEVSVKVKFGGKETEYTVKVLAVYISKIEITTPAEKTEYFCGEALDTTGLVLSVTYNNGKVIETDEYETEFDSSKAGDKVSVKVKFGGKETEYTVKVTAVAVSKIEITAAAEKTEYFCGEALDTKGLEITVTYNNGKTIETDEYETEFDSSKAGDSIPVKVKYAGKEDSYTVKVTAITVTKLEITKPAKRLEFDLNEEFDSTGLEVTATYNNGDVKVVTDYLVNDGNATASYGLGKTVTVSLGGCQDTYSIDVLYQFHETITKTGSKTYTSSTCVKNSDGKYAAGESITKDYDLVTFGDWPRTIKADDVDITDRKKVIGGNTYYLGSDYQWYVKQLENAYDESALNLASGEKSEYSPKEPDKNKYTDGTVVQLKSAGSYRWFKVEPITWRVLTENYNGSGNALLLPEEMIMSGVPYFAYSTSSNTRVVNGETVNLNNYKYSTIRAYLNGAYEDGDDQKDNYTDFTGIGFLQSAFTEKAQNLIAVTEVDNSGVQSSDTMQRMKTIEGKYACENTMDKVFLLSVRESGTRDYGFDEDIQSSGMNTARFHHYTDYTLANFALSTSKASNMPGGWWWLRSPTNSTTGAYLIRVSGYSNTSSQVNASKLGDGIVPAICVTM